MTSDRRNVPESIRARLLNLSRDRHEDFNLTLSRYVAERFLYRLGQSAYRERHVLRNGAIDRESIHEDISAICAVNGGPDGLRFDASQLILEEIRERNRYRGMRIRVPATLGSARLTLQIDMGFGDAVYPAPTTLAIESL